MKIQAKTKLNNTIIKYAAKIAEVNIETIKSKGKGSTAISDARRIAALLLRKHTRLTYYEIGSLFGGRNHDLIMYYVNSAVDLSESNKSFKQDLIFLDKKIIKFKFENNLEHEDDYVNYKTKKRVNETKQKNENLVNK